MATSASFIEEECLNVYWKIKNFSYCCKKIQSPVFNVFGNSYCLCITPESAGLQCDIVAYPVFASDTRIATQKQISFLTCDGTPEESISGANLFVPRIIFGDKRSSLLPDGTLTVRLRIPTDSERWKIFICSQIGVKRKCFLWTLKDICNQERNTIFTKTVECSHTFGNINLSLNPMTGFNTDEKFCIEMSRTGGEKCCLTLKMSILDPNGIAFNEVRDEFIFEKKAGEQTRGFPAFFKKRKYLECKTLFPPEDAWSLKFDFAISSGTLTGESVFNYCENAAKQLLKNSDHLSITFKEKRNSVSATDLQTDLKSILDEGTLFDTRLEIGAEVIQVHKTILSARSPVFRAMFTKDMQEKNSNRVILEDLDAETVRRLVLYMYTDAIHDDQWENSKKLYSVADKYEILSLKKKCVSILKNNFTISNVCEALALAGLHQDNDLKMAAIDFIYENDSVVFHSDVWKEFEKNYSLSAVEVMREIYCNKHIRLD